MRAQRFFVFLVLVALVAVGCRASVDVQPTEAALAAADEANADASDPEDPTDGEPDVEDVPAEDDPEDEPAGSTSGSASGGSATFDAIPDYVVPDGWADPLALDSEVLTGTLENGMDYLVREIPRPGGQAQLRLVVEVGSVDEDPEDAGIAHFLEHMMFNGTEAYPKNEIVTLLESFGATFGPDVNAYTSFDETVYELVVPTRGDGLDEGLGVLFQWASKATLIEEDVVAERGVVREELRRSVEPLSGRIFAQVRNVLFGGTPYDNKLPIGQADVIENMSREQLLAFYERWYQPEAMTIVAVGDFNPQAVEQLIIETFTQPATSELPERPAIEPAGPLVEPVFETITDSEIDQIDLEVLWRLNGDGPTTTKLGLRSNLLSNITLGMLSERMFERVQNGDSAFINAGASGGDFVAGTQLVQVLGQTNVEDLDAGLTELLVVMEQARQHGFTQLELDRTVESIRAGVELRYESRETRQDTDVAAELVGYALGTNVLLETDVERDVVNEVLDSITVRDAQRLIDQALRTDPYVLITAPESVEAELPTPEELASQYYDIIGTAVDAPGEDREAVTELMAAPEPAAIVDEDYIRALDATVITFENGARLAYKPTTITDNVVILGGSSPGGFFAVDSPDVPMLQESFGLINGSGFESIDIVDLDRYLSGFIASASTSVGRSEEFVSGEASTEDAEIMFQLIHLSMTEPTIGDVQVRQFDEATRPIVENPALRPEIAADLELWRLRYGDSPWFRYLPTVDDLDLFEERGADALVEAYAGRFENAGDFTFVVVGDFDEAELRDLGARYLGTLPDNGVREEPIQRDPGVPEENLQATVRAGVGDQGQVRINWESSYPFTIEADVAAQALELVVNARIRDLIREELSASYSPRATVFVAAEPEPWVDSIIEVESDPDRVEEVSVTVREELDRIRAGEIDEQYLELAVDQLTEGYRFSTNQDWIDLIAFHIRYPDRAPGEFRSRTSIAQSLTIADLADAANVVFPESRSVEVWLLPADS